MGTTLFGRVLGAGALALSLGILSTGTAHAAVPACTDSWTNAAGGQWDTGSNWSAGHAPGASDTACITKAGSYTVVVGNETISVANLTVGATGSTPTLQIGNSGSGYPHVTVAGTVTNAGTISDGWGDTFIAQTLANSGAFTVPSTGYGDNLTLTTTSNTGSVSVAGGATVSIPNGGTFDNAGALSSTGTGALAFSSPTAGAGTVQLDSGSRTAIDSSAALTVADRVAVNGGSVCGNTLTVGSGSGGGALAFAQTPGTGPACAAGQPSDQVAIANVAATLSGTIPAAWTVTLGNTGSNYNTTTLSGNVVNQGTLRPQAGATLTGSASANELTNQGTLDVPHTGYPTVLNTTLVNTGTVTIADAVTASLNGDQRWTNGTTGKDGTISVASNGSLAITSPSGQSATFVQDGTLANQGTVNVADAIQVNGGSICGNPLTLGPNGTGGGSLTFAATPAKGAGCATGVASGHVAIANVTATLNSNVPAGYTVVIGNGGSGYAHVSTPGPLTVSGTLEPGDGTTLTVNGAVTIASTGKLVVPKTGYDSSLIAPSAVNSGTISLADNLALSGALTNKKALSIAAGKHLSVGQTFTQSSTGTYTDGVSGASFGQLQVTGAATLAGKLVLAAPKAAGLAYRVLTDNGTTGTFAAVKGYAVTYDQTGVTATSAPTATIKLSPTSGTAPVKVKVTGTGFGTAETVAIALDGPTVLGTVKSSSTGSVSTTVTIPAGTATGAHTVTATGQTTHQAASATFTVNGNPT